MSSTPKTFIVEGLRLPVGKANGIYKKVIPEILAGQILSNWVKKHAFLPEKTDEIILGCALGTGGNMARYAALEGGLGIKTPAYTVDAQCASGLKAIILADAQLKSGANLIIAGGMESNSLAPKRQYHKNDPRYIDELTFYQEATFAPLQFGHDLSLVKAAESVAQKFNITKKAMMQWTADSHQKACQAIDNEYFKNCIIPYNNLKKDQAVRSSLTFESLDKTQSEALIDYTNTAHLHDGACMHLLASEQFCKENNWQPEFQILKTCIAAGEPNWAPMAVIWAVEKLMLQVGLGKDEIDLFEINESFAVNALAFAQYFQINPAKINIFGGNLAFGHPFGASGAINLLHLMQAMKHENAKKGIVAIAAAGGLGMAILIEKIGSN